MAPHMPSFVFVLSATAMALSLLTASRTELTHTRHGKILAFLVLFLLPSMALWAGISEQMERSKSTAFCLSCHVMSDFGKSLYVDDRSYLPAAHFQNNRVARDQACYTCHTDYAIFGSVRAKLRGLRHVYVQYLGTIPKPENIRLYQPYNNRECLHCHEGARSFVEASAHKRRPEMLTEIASNALSCMSSNCHDIVHDVDTLGDVRFWKEDR